MFRRALSLVGLFALISSTALAASTSKLFKPGSIIIPQSAVYQTGCGSVSAYGLVYRLLLENKSGGVFGPTEPVTIYWSIDPAKKSLNRCVPSNKHTTPSTSPGLYTTDWNDGCDFIVGPSATLQPVVKVNLTVAVPTGSPAMYATGAVTNYNTTYTGVKAVPGFTSVTLDNSNSTPRFTTARYEGGPFIIDVSDAQRVLNFLKTDPKMADFRTVCGSGGIPACDGQSNDSSRSFSAATADQCHEVNMHMNTVEFTAPIYRRITNIPPHIGVLTNGAGVKGDMLPKYMASAGLDFSGAIGCPVGHPGCPTGTSTSGVIYDRLSSLEDLRSLTAAEATALNGGTATTALPDGLINGVDPTNNPYFQVLWTPHWELSLSLNASGNGSTCDDVRDAVYDACRNGKKTNGSQMSKDDCRSIRDSAKTACDAASSTVATTQAAVAANGLFSQLNGGTRTAVNNAIAANFPAANTDTLARMNSALANINTFTNRSGTGLFAECASVSTFETAFQTNGNGRFKWVEPNSASIDTGRGYSATPRFMYSNGILINGLAAGTNANCTDPNYSGSGDCIIYPMPGNAFSQIGDFQFTSAVAHTIDWIPMQPSLKSWESGHTAITGGNSAFKNGALVLARSWTSFAGTTQARAVTGTPSWEYLTPSAKNGWTFFSLMQKDNDPNKAMILYLGGHEFSNSPAGTRIALNTLLNLGADPIRADRSITAPVAFDDVNGTFGTGTRALVVSSTYQAVSGVLPSGAEVFNPATGSQWQFPLIRGDLRAHKLDGTGALGAGEQALNDGMLWSATAALPAPDARNIFTYVGGQLASAPAATVCTNTGSCSPDPTVYVAPNGVVQANWKPVNVAPASIVAPSGTSNAGCVDVVRQANKNDNLDNTSKFGFANGSDGICDLQQLMQYTNLNPDSSGVLQTPDITNLTNDVPYVKQILSIVRGHCYATAGKIDGAGTPNYAPANTDCNSNKQSNTSRLGGLVRSTAAVVPASPNIPANCSSGACTRPTVAYVGGYDGMLHAFYVSGGTNYIAPAAAMHYPNTPAHTVFSTGVSGWTPPARGTELWAFMPSSQLPFLAHNDANVDSSVLVQDVFADFVGSGKREWHTVLVTSAGADSREIFAIDVTDPLRPVMLWDVVGSTRRTGASTPRMASVAELNDSNLGSHFTVNKWDGDSSSTIYKLAPATDPGRGASKAYDYTDLGGASSLSMGLLRVGLNPVYAAFVATSASALASTPTKGLAVFAIDVSTGQKLWEWEREFDSADTSRPHDNYTPRGVTLYYGTEGATTVLVGDYDGRLWELDAATGTNRNFQRVSCSSDCNLPAFDTGSTVANPQPITSNIALAKLPATGVSGDFGTYSGQTMVLFGTAGATAVPSTVSGAVHALLLGNNYRKPLTACTSCTSNVTGTTWSDLNAVVADARATGVLQEPTTWPKTLPTGDRVYGFLTVAGTTAFVPAVTGQVAIEDLMNIDPNTVGKTYALDLGSFSGSVTSSNSLTGFEKANFGGVAVYNWDLGAGNSKQTVVGTEISKIARYDNASHPTGSGAMDPDKKLKTNAGETGAGYRLLNWFRKLAK